MKSKVHRVQQTGKVFLNEISTIVEVFSEETSFDPKHEFQFEKLPRLVYLKQNLRKVNWEDFVIDVDEVKSNSKLYQLLFGILHLDNFQFFTNETIIPHHYLVEKLRLLETYFNDKYADKDKTFRTLKLDCLEFLMSQCIAIRLVKEIRYSNIPFPYAPITFEEAKIDFEQLIAEVKKDNRKLDLHNAFRIRLQGDIASNYFMQNQRLSTSNGARKSLKNKREYTSPSKAWTEEFMVSVFSALIRLKTMKARKREDHYNFQINLAVSASKVRLKLVRNWGANQFNPKKVGVLVQLLKNKYNTSVTSFLDLCGGWGDRLIGAFAASAIGLKRYVATDPNPNLKEGYSNMVDQFRPAGFDVYIHAKPMEDCTQEELCPQNQPNQLMLTSPPYFDLEKYPGENQSHIRYPVYENWLNKFLFVLVQQAIKGLSPGGFIAININNQKHHKPGDDLLNYLKGCPYLEVIGLLESSSVKPNPTYLAKFIGDWVLLMNPVTNKDPENTSIKQGFKQELQVFDNALLLQNKRKTNDLESTATFSSELSTPTRDSAKNLYSSEDKENSDSLGSLPDKNFDDLQIVRKKSRTELPTIAPFRNLLFFIPSMQTLADPNNLTKYSQIADNSFAN
ncbi:site-specific DNA-methyltransferase [Legionella sp. 16cNR16C]|uniref:site-specific DNA-methyltransferase n=1 Tax=Legionella sp. 16cNR16C TaxID=2905656 RepID=UPI001E4CE0FC|nr:site-specific DNA-methyltransferase [Legionella sp. 16cNR16C]MCE3046440.1 site-specific DNA-methyltransferase [Legionella sp. 16cNR16C]